MTIEIHRLLRKQLKKELGLDSIPDNMVNFIQSVNAAYLEFENDRNLMERSIDISSREYNDRTNELKEAKEHLADLIKAIPQGVMIIGADDKISFANSATRRIFGLPAAEIIGKNFNDPLWQMRNAEGRLLNGEELPPRLIMLSDEPVIRAEYAITSLDGKNRILYITAAPLHDSNGNAAGTVMTIEDITVRKEMEKQLKYLSLHDALTGLYNRTFFEEEMRRLGSGRYNPVGIIVVDIDGLKLVNDTLGHERGDKVLLTAANIVRSCFRDNDVVARIGGDEFAILLEFSSKNEIEIAIRKIKKAVEKHGARQADPFPFSLSIGFALSGLDEVDTAFLFKEADKNMYREKLHHRQSARSAIVQALVKAMEARDFATEGHAGRMRDLAEMLAISIGLDERRIADIRLFAHFHDIGKVGTPDRILFKPGPLSSEEIDEMRNHCEIGRRIAESAIALSPITDWILKHHEWWNGNGYPLGLAKEEIPLECRILSIVDTYDAMTSDRPYRKALSHEQAVIELERCAGTQFDPELVNRFIRLFTKDQQPQ